MNNIVWMIMVVAILVTGCNDSNTPKEIEKIYSTAVIQYSDGNVMGVTRNEPPTQESYGIYNIDTGEIVGVIRYDSTVAVANGGMELGKCETTVVNDDGVSGDCLLPKCPDTRNGDHNPAYSPDKCNFNGYFWFPLAKICLNKPVNVKECGEIWER